jgi:uroporphyrinogen decarboxylase
MTGKEYSENVARFERIVGERKRDETMAALIIDSPWLPGFAGMDTRDFLFDTAAWLAAYEKAHAALPGAVFIPDVWVELGMAAEPSGFGVPIQWHGNMPPSILPFPGGLQGLVDAETPDPERDGLMPMMLRQYERMMPLLAERGMPPRMAAARGPLAVAGHLAGLTELLMATQIDPDKCLAVVEKTTELCIRWLKSQLDRMDDPVAVLVLDDVVGLISPDDAERFGTPFLKRIFDAFPDLVRVFHDDTPNKAVFPGLARVGFDVFNFSHEVDMEEARDLVGPDMVFMGNLPPLDLLVRGTPKEVGEATRALVKRMDQVGPLLLSPGGGVSPGTPVENLQAMLNALENPS